MATNTIVKVCGLTSVADARMARAAGADWFGIVLDGDGPRRVTAERGREIAAALAGCEIVAVLVAPTPEDALARARAVGACRVQLHRVDPLAWPIAFPLPVVIAVPVADDGAIGAALPHAAHTVLLDRADPAVPGGSGRTFPWETARVVAATRPLVLAGGLGPDNVADAIGHVRPFGVDASSRLESRPGVKDPELVRRFVAAVRAWREPRTDRP